MCSSDLLYLGCSPRTCLGTCDKARAGVCIDGLLCRFSCAHFGQKLAGVPLNCILNQFACHCVRRVMSRGLPRLSELSLPHDVPTSSGEPSRCAEQVGDAACPVALVEDADSPIVPCTYGAPGSVPPGCALGPLMVSLWVDDLLTAQNIYYHGRCGGLVGGCHICATLLSHFTESQHYMRNLAAQLGFSLHAKKRQEPSQRATYTGIIIDTVAFRLFIPDDKLAKLRSSLLELISAESCSFRSLAAVRGRLLHYSVCILHIRPLVPAISDGPESEASYDSPRPVRDHLRKAADRLLDVIGRYAPLGAPISQFVPSSLYGAFLRGETREAHVVVVIWDASKHGYGAVVRTHKDRCGPGTLVVGTFERGLDVSEQVYREAIGG